MCEGSPIECSSSGLLLATFGFLRQHKGLLELVEAVDILRSIFPDVRLLAQTALYPSDESIKYLARVRRRITELDLVDAVNVDPQYVDIEVAIARLAESVAVVLPYGDSDEGASAAAAAVLASRRPLIVTRAKIFDELRSIAYTAEGNAPPVLAAAIAAVVGIPGLRGQLECNASRAADERRWTVVARRLLETIGLPVGRGSEPANVEAPRNSDLRNARA
jgi:glycosyltransferase involved in cell wall biosynthesis